MERSLSTNLKDLPFTLTYLFDEQGKAHLACSTGIVSGHPIAPAQIDPALDKAWRVDELLAHPAMLSVGDLDIRTSGF